jgi:heme o synthase
MKNRNNPSRVSVMMKLTRLYLSLAIAFSALVGFIFYRHTVDMTALYTFLGVFLLSASASALNQYQERHLDVFMKRTQSRPLPAGQIAPRMVLVVAFVLGLAGTLLLFFETNTLTALLGLLNLFWYNVVYTPLKRKTLYVVLIGALTGALPPMMGWTAAGGDALDPMILYVAFFMFLWQIPHFLLLLMKFGKEYEAAGFPSITSHIDEQRVKFIVFVWILGTSISTLFFPLYHIIFSIYLVAPLIIANGVLIFYFYRNVFSKAFAFNFGSAFRSLYLYQVFILVILTIEALL